MTLLAPAWLLLIPLVLLLGRQWPALRLTQPLRLAFLVLLALLLARPRIAWREAGLDLLVLVDQSQSARASIQPRLAEWEAILERSRGERDRIRTIDFAAEPQLRERSAGYFEGDPRKTRLAQAIRYALNQVEPSRHARLLVLTDGLSTEPLDGLEPLCSQANVPVDYRLPVAALNSGARLGAFTAPARVRPGEPFLVEIPVTGPAGQSIPWVATRNGQPLGSGQVVLDRNGARLRFADRWTGPGAAAYEIRLQPASGVEEGAHRARFWVEAVAGSRVLVLSPYPDDPTVSTLRQAGFTVDHVTDVRTLSVGRLAGVRAVWINDVPADAFTSELRDALAVLVTAQGSGLVMTGGKHSFGPGGYFGSPIDDLLPVSMELRKDQWKLMTALAIVMDRSGSMAAGAGHGTKMDLANDGAARAIELLGNRDLITVFAVDSEAHKIVPLTPAGNERAKLTATVRRVQSMGGGIFVYVGMKAGWEELKTAKTGQRHMILFADANDSEEPGDYVGLIDEMRRQGATVSVIALGSESDHDADLLKDIAKRGGGRAFFNMNAADLPALFSQETVAIARAAFIDQTTKIVGNASGRMISPRPFVWPESVNGFNLNYAKPEASVALRAKDEYDSPLFAFWQRGAGRAAALSCPVVGPYSETLRTWTGYGDLIQTLNRWLVGGETPNGLKLSTEVRGEFLELNLWFDPTWAERFAHTTPRAWVRGTSAGVAEVAWEKMEPGRFRARVRAEFGVPVIGGVQVGEQTLPFGPLAIATDPEWAVDPARIDELRALARATGGQERMDLASVWKTPTPASYRSFDFWLGLILLFLWLADAWVTRRGNFINPRLTQDEAIH